MRYDPIKEENVYETDRFEELCALEFSKENHYLYNNSSIKVKKLTFYCSLLLKKKKKEELRRRI